MKIALCLEYPIGKFGGTEIIVQELLRGLPKKYEIILISPDTPESLAASPVASLVPEHLFWDPKKASRSTSRSLATALAARGVKLAHFHLGGNYGWGNARPGRSPPGHWLHPRIQVS